MAITAKEVRYLTATDLAGKLKNREISAVELLDATYENINNAEPKIEAFNNLTKDLAYTMAGQVDNKIKNNESLPPLAGIPLAIKDNMCLKGFPTTCSSKILESFTPPYTATAVKRLLDNLIIPIGKTNLDEFAMGSSTENSAFKLTKNPWDLSKVPGGSSGGSGAAVAAGETSLSLGSDTGGSIRLPASFCGVVGMKPTYGLVSRFGLVAYASSLDQIGPFARTVTDLAAILQVITGYDKLDSTSIKTDIPDYSGYLNTDLKGTRIGVITELMGEGVNSDIVDAIQKCIKHFENFGATIEEVSMPHNKYAIAAYYIIATAEASANLARYDGVKYGYRNSDAEDIMEMYLNTRKEGFGPEVKRRIMLGTYALSAGYYDAYYKKAQQVRTLIKRDFDKAFKSCDLLISPVCTSTAFGIGQKVDDPLSMYLMDIATVTCNLAGIPGISVPCGLDSSNLPIGLQVLGPALSEGKVLQASYAVEQAIGFNSNYKLLEGLY